MNSDQLRYLMVSVDAPPRIGGISLLAEQLAEHIVRKHAKECVFVGPSGTYFAGQPSFKVYEDLASAPERREGPYAHHEDERIEDLFLNIIERYSLNRILLFHAFYYGPGALRAAEAASIPVFTYVHGTELTSQFPDALNGNVEPPTDDPDCETLASRLHLVLNKSTKILANSHYTAKIAARIAPSVRTIVTGCGLDVDAIERERKCSPRYRSLERRIRRERLGLAERPTLISVGRLVPHKNVESGIRLLTELKNFQYIVVGTGPHEAALKAYARSLSVSDRVIFVGKVEEQKKWQYIRAADFGLLMSRHDPKTNGYEGFGIVMLEYAAAGCLPVTNGADGMEDFSKRFEGALVCSDAKEDVTATASALFNLTKDEEQLADLVDRSRDVMNARYRWNTVAEIAAI